MATATGHVYAYAWLGEVLGPHFGDYQAGFRFGRLGWIWSRTRGLDRFRLASTWFSAVHVCSLDAGTVQSCRDVLRRAFEAAPDAGDLTYAAYSCMDLNTNLLRRGRFAR